jgi:putative hydrolase of the HAD superfamily
VIRAVVSDLFGTVTPKWSNRASDQAKTSIAAMLGVPAPAFLESWNATWQDRETGRLSLHASFVDALGRLGVPYDDALIARLSAMWSNLVEERLVARNAQVTETLRWCRARGMKLGLVSNAGPAVPAAFQRSPIAELFDATVFSCETRTSKPDPRIFRYVCELLSVRPGDCLYVGDGGDDELQGAQRIGMMPVLLRVQSEIEEEGLPSGAARWNGPVIECFTGLRAHVEAPSRRSADRPDGRIEEWAPPKIAREAGW